MTTTTRPAVSLKNLRPGSLLNVETKTRHYRVEYLGGSAIRISGHPQHCPDPVQACLQGSIDKDGVLEIGLIQPGARLIFFLNDELPVTTSKILRVRCDRTEAGLED